MAHRRRNAIVYGLLIAVWLVVLGWQVEEHVRVKQTARMDLRNRSREIANTLSAVIRALRFRGTILQDRLEPVLNELVSGRTNELVSSSELISIALLNTANEPVVSAGRPIDPQDIGPEGERWGRNIVTFVNPVEGANVRPEGATNTTVVLPPPRDFTNGPPDGFRGRGFHREPGTNGPPEFRNDGPGGEHRPDGSPRREEVGNGERPRERPPEVRPRRPPWMRWMDEKEFEALIAKRELHGLVLAMSTSTVEATARNDFWLRCIIAFFASISALGVAVAWRNLAKSSDLQLRLVRASELNTHLREMNLAAAGLAHETRNPLNIIRGMAQMISKQPVVAGEIQEKSRAIVEEADKVTAQLNEFINYSRPRELRRSAVSLPGAVNEVARALSYDIEEKKIRVEVKGESLAIEADEQMLRQVLFNLVLNAIQALPEGGEIQVVAQRGGASEAALEIRDNGPGVPLEQRQDIFRPYFTTQQKGTGLGLAIVQQIVLAHGWDIECLSNQPHGAVFRITHLKVAVKS